MFNEQLKNIRKTSGKTQKDLADYLQISAQSISKWEKGEALPSLEFLPRLQDSLDAASMHSSQKLREIVVAFQKAMILPGKLLSWKKRLMVH